MRTFVAAIVAAVLFLPQPTGHAQTYPTKPIKLVVPFGPGSATDTLARITAQDLSQSIGQQVVVVNKAGADGSIAAVEVKRSAPDGYTLMFGTNSPLVVVPNIRKEPPYDTIADFTPITHIGENAIFLVVHPSVPAKTVPELIAHAKANPKKLNYATGNTIGIVATGMLATNAGIEMLHVPYKSEPDAITDLLSGQVHVMNATFTTVGPHVQAGTLRVLAATMNERSPVMPDVPSIVEAGQPKLPVGAWFALVGPAGMPPEIVAFLNKEMAATLFKPAIRQQMEKQGFTPRASTPQELAAIIKDQLAVWKAALKAAGIEPQ